mgnify:CR=1 FL=1
MSKMEDEMTAFQIDERDNVATALKGDRKTSWRQPGKKAFSQRRDPCGT